MNPGRLAPGSYKAKWIMTLLKWARAVTHPSAIFELGASLWTAAAEGFDAKRQTPATPLWQGQRGANV